MFIKLYAIALPIFLIIDIVWLGLLAKTFYRDQIGFLMRTNFNWIAAGLFYIFFIAALILFVISPAIEKNSLMYALVMGALFGFITYATYDLTNLAVIKDWPVLVTVVDLIWGTFIAASVSVLTYIIALKIIV